MPTKVLVSGNPLNGYDASFCANPIELQYETAPGQGTKFWFETELPPAP